MPWPYEISQAIIEHYKREFLLKGRASEFDVADCMLAIENWQHEQVGLLGESTIEQIGKMAYPKGERGL